MRTTLALLSLALAGCFDFDRIEQPNVPTPSGCAVDPAASLSWQLQPLPFGGRVTDLVDSDPVLALGYGPTGAFNNGGGWTALPFTTQDNGPFLQGTRLPNGYVALAHNAADLRLVLGHKSGASFSFVDESVSVFSAMDPTVGVAFDGTHLFLATNASTAWTDETGSTWQLAPINGQNVFAIAGSESGDAVLCGYDHVERWDPTRLQWTENGLEQGMGTPDSHYTCTSLVTSRIVEGRHRIWLTNTLGQVCTHEDGGADKWRCVDSVIGANNDPKLAVAPCDPSFAVVVGPKAGQVAFTQDGGQSWHAQTTNIMAGLGSVKIDAQGVVYVGEAIPSSGANPRVWARLPVP